MQPLIHHAEHQYAGGEECPDPLLPSQLMVQVEGRVCYLEVTFSTDLESLPAAQFPFARQTHREGNLANPATAVLHTSCSLSSSNHNEPHRIVPIKGSDPGQGRAFERSAFSRERESRHFGSNKEMQLTLTRGDPVIHTLPHPSEKAPVANGRHGFCSQ